MAEWQSTLAGRHLAGRSKTDTKPEVLLRRALHRHGARYRLHVTLARGCTPDLVMPRRRLAVFVDGCFWHSCPRHGRRSPFVGPNAALWEEKMRRNRARDMTATATATTLGWRVVRVWECDVVGTPDQTAERILSRGI
jgi:DNA mismatch endonuclease (patch repair protein)